MVKVKQLKQSLAAVDTDIMSSNPKLGMCVLLLSDSFGIETRIKSLVLII